MEPAYRAATEAPLDLVSRTEIAVMLDVGSARVGQLVRTVKDFPPPAVRSSTGRGMWYRTDIERWVEATAGRRARHRPKVGGQRAAFVIADEVASA
jgi:hypothetical protein